MSRKLKNIKFEIEPDEEEGEVTTKDVTVKELKVKQVKRILFSATSTAKDKAAINAEKEKEQKAEEEKELLTEGEEEVEEGPEVIQTIFDMFGKEFKELFDLTVKGIGWDELEELAPSQIEELYEGFKEVNSVFFQVAQSMGIIEGVQTVLGSLKEDLLEGFVSVFATAMKTS